MHSECSLFNFPKKSHPFLTRGKQTKSTNPKSYKEQGSVCTLNLYSISARAENLYLFCR
jgi:hypothetical protein